MLYAMLIAHLLGDYVLQPGRLARWKARSPVGVLVHGGIVTITTLACAGLVDPAWWPYALLIGLAHTSIDLARARFLRTTNPGWQLIWYVLDQLAHVTVIVSTAIWSGAFLRSQPVLAFQAGKWLADSRTSIHVIGYLLLLNPVWVFLRFAVRGVCGPDTVAHLLAGEKLGPMVERVLIASCVLTGQFHLAPLVLVPRRLAPVRVQGMGVGVMIHSTGHWAATALSVSLAVAVGLTLRMV
jgi:hypothetical protein